VVQFISATGFSGREGASFSGRSLIETGLFPTETGAAAPQAEIRTEKIKNNMARRNIEFDSSENVPGC
jgi:hypothetical protein